MKRVLLLFLVLMAGSSAAFSQDVDDLVYMAENYPPANYLEDGVLKGASVELLRLMWKKMGYPEQPIHIYPWARGYMWAQTKRNHVLFTMSRTREREHLFKWVGPVFTARHVLIGLADRKITLHSLEDAKKYTIGTVINDIGEVSLLKAGYERDKLESVPGLELNIKKLLLGRVDLICQSEASVQEFIEMYHYDPGQFKTFFVVNEIKNYYAFHKETSDLLIRKFQAALDSLKREHREILKNYKMAP